MSKREVSDQLIETKYGFKWGQAKVERCVSVNEYKVIVIETPRQTLQVTITPTGLISTSMPVRAKLRINNGSQE